MKIIILDRFTSKVVIKEVGFIPVIGHHIDMPYTPSPKVNCVVCYPTESTLSSLGLTECQQIDAIVTVE